MSPVRDSDGRRSAWARYVEELADEVGLRDWTVVVGDCELPDGDDGQCKIVFGRKLARVLVRRGLSAAETRYVAVHELVHCHLEPSVAIVRDELKPFLGEPADAAIWLGFNSHHEYAVDAIALALAKHLPLPSDAALRR